MLISFIRLFILCVYHVVFALHGGRSGSHVFAINNGLRGVHMCDFVTSQVGCNLFFDTPLPTEEKVRESNEALTALMATTLSQPGGPITGDRLAVLKEEYAKLAGDNQVVAFNVSRLRYYAGVWPPP